MLPASEATANIIRENWIRVEQRVAEACRLADRPAEQVQIVGVSKYVDAPLAMQLVAAGCHILGENRPQSLWAKADSWACNGQVAGVEQPISPAWHLIGHLQRNKLRRTLPLISYLHSLDSLRLAEAINLSVLESGRDSLPVLVEVNPTNDPQKTGLPPSEVHSFLEAALPLPGIQVRGLMAMSSLQASSSVARREFAQVRQMRDELQAAFGDDVQLAELSMGMSGDFDQAIAEGATLVRIGTLLWEGVLI
jgi:pyridoxal phosphate enzyme (YggS family)